MNTVLTKLSEAMTFFVIIRFCLFNLKVCHPKTHIGADRERVYQTCPHSGELISLENIGCIDENSVNQCDIGRENVCYL